MPRALKIAAAAVAALLLLAVAVVAILAATFDPNAWKPELQARVKAQTGRTLEIPGRIELALWPSIGARVGAATLSERGSAQTFAEWRSAQASLALWPLLKRQVVVERVAVDGLKLRLARGAGGRWNVDDLAGGGSRAPAAAAPAAAPQGPDIGGIVIRDAEVTVDDAGQRSTLALKELTVGRLAPGASTDLKLDAHWRGAPPLADVPLALKARLTLAERGFDATLDARIDQTTLKGRVGAPTLEPLALRVDLDVDALDIDRWTAAAPAAAAPAPRPAAPPDLGALRTLDLQGRVRVGALKVAGMKASAVDLGLKAGGGRAVVEPLNFALYGGRAAGSATLAAANPPRWTLKQTLTGVAVGPLLKDATGRDVLEGRGDLQLDLAAQGATPEALRRSLGGSARLVLKDGAVRGINIAQSIRDVKAKLAGASGAGAAGARTDFSEATASFRIAGGVARNDDLDAKSPLLRLGGSGEVDLGAGRLDYVVRATVVPTLEGQGGPELQALRGQTVPVRVYGPFEAVQWKVELGEVVKDRVEQKLKDKLGNALKGLFR